MEAELTWQKLVKRFQFWREDPPPAVMLQILAAAWGWKPPEKPKPAAETMDALRALFPTGKI